jgi:hypothetical protein
MIKGQVNAQVAARKGATEQSASLCFINCGQRDWIVFAQGKIAVGNIGITRTAVTLSTLGGQYYMGIGGSFQQILVIGTFETELLSVTGGEFNSVSIHVVFGLQKNAAGKAVSVRALFEKGGFQSGRWAELLQKAYTFRQRGRG